MANPDKWLGHHRDLPIAAGEQFTSATAGTGSDYEHVIFALPNLALNVASGTASDLPVNSMNVRSINLTTEANLTGTATNYMTWNFWQKRAGAILVSTSSSTTVTASTMAVTPASMSNIYVGSQLIFAGGTGATETVTVASLTPTTFTATFANGHSGGYTITSAPLATATYTTTSSSTTITASTMAVTPASMASIYVGSQLTLSGGTGSAETVVVTSVTSTTFTATFANGHSGAYVIAIAEVALVPHQFNVLVNNAQALLPGDIVTIARLSNNATGLASPALTVILDLVPAGIGR